MSGTPLNAVAARSPLPVVVAASAAVLTLSLWVTHQGGLDPKSSVQFVSLIYLILTTLPVVAAIWFAALGYGWPICNRFVLRSRGGLTLQAIVGLGCFLLLAWLFALAAGMRFVSAWSLCGLGWVLLIWQMLLPRNRKLWSAVPLPEPSWVWVLAMPAVAMLIVASAIPPSLMWSVEAGGYDVLSYHLQVPREWLELGRMQGLQHNIYSHLPSLIEAGYTCIGAMRGSMYDGIYDAQFFHASMAIFSAACVAKLVTRFAGKHAGAAAGVVVLVTPWTIITGSLAYDEMGMLAFGAAALLVVFDDECVNWRGGAVAGFLAGCATLAKLPAGPMIAVPVGMMVVWRGGTGTKVPVPRKSAGIQVIRGRASGMVLGFAFAGVLTLVPYFARNAAWTGNPVFPFAPNMLGTGYWSDIEVDRWKSAHGPVGDFDSRLTELGRQWLCNAGYGAVDATPRLRTHDGPDWRNVASFHTEWGFPVLWAAAALGVVAGLTWKGRRQLTLVMLVMLICQLAFWLATTHLQSRFLFPSLLPGAVWIGLGVGRLWNMNHRTARLVAAIVVIVIGTVLTSVSYGIFITQTPLLPDGTRLAPWEIADSLPRLDDWDKIKFGEALVGDHRIDRLPPDSKTLLIADVSRLLYLRRPIVYNSAFDPNPLGKIIRETGGEPAAVTAALRKMGVTNVWINWGELIRLWSTYGFDKDVTPRKVHELTEQWKRTYAEPEGKEAIVELYDIR